MHGIHTVERELIPAICLLSSISGFTSWPLQPTMEWQFYLKNVFLIILWFFCLWSQTSILYSISIVFMSFLLHFTDQGKHATLVAVLALFHYNGEIYFHPPQNIILIFLWLNSTLSEHGPGMESSEEISECLWENCKKTRQGSYPSEPF